MEFWQRINGSAALLFTDQPVDSVLEFFSNWIVPEFAKGGHISPTTIVLPVGPLEGFPVMMMDTFRKLGLVVEADNGVLVLREPFTAATEGEPLSHGQCKLLVSVASLHCTHPSWLLTITQEKLDVKLVNFTIQVECYWSNGEFSVL